MPETAPPPALVASVAVGAARRVVWTILTPARARYVRLRRLREGRSIGTARLPLQWTLSIVGLAVFGVLSYYLLRGKYWAWIVRVVLSATGLLYVLARDRWGVLTAVTSAVELAFLLTPSARRYARV